MGDSEDHEIVDHFLSGDTEETSRQIHCPFNLAPLARTLTSASSWSAMFYRTHGHEYSLEQWGRMIRASATLGSAEVVQMDRYYHQKATTRHRFLVLRLRRKNNHKDIFLRLDRRPMAGINPLKFAVASRIRAANDCAFLAADENRAVRGNTPTKTSISLETSLIFPDPLLTPSLSYFGNILDAIGLHMQKYKFSNENCWLFCSVCLESLSDAFQGRTIVGTLRHTGLPAAPELRVLIEGQSTPPQITASSLPPPPLTSQSLLPPIRSRSIPSHSSPLIPEPEPLILTPSRSQPQPSASPSPMYSPLTLPSHELLPLPPISPSSLQPSLPPPQSSTAPSPLLSSQSYPSSRHLLREFLVGAVVTAIAVHSNGSRFVSGSNDYAVRLWDPVTGTMIGTPLEGHTHEVTSVTFSPDGQRIASGSVDATVRIWDAITGAAIGSPLEGHTSGVSSVAFSPDRLHLASGSFDGTVRLWDASTGTAIGGPSKRHAGWIYSIAFSPDGRRIASATDDMDIRIWDIVQGTTIHGFGGHTGCINSVAFSPDGQSIVSGSDDSTVRLWNAAMGKLASEPLKHSGYVCSVAYSPDGRYIVSGSSDGIVRLWDTATGGAVGEPTRGHTNSVKSIAFFPDGRHILSGSRDKTIRMWETPI